PFAQTARLNPFCSLWKGHFHRYARPPRSGAGPKSCSTRRRRSQLSFKCWVSTMLYLSPMNFVTPVTKAKMTKNDLCHRRDRIGIDQFVLLRGTTPPAVGILDADHPPIVFQRLEGLQHGLARRAQGAVQIAHGGAAAAGFEQAQHTVFQPSFFVLA